MSEERQEGAQTTSLRSRLNFTTNCRFNCLPHSSLVPGHRIHHKTSGPRLLSRDLSQALEVLHRSSQTQQFCYTCYAGKNRWKPQRHDSEYPNKGTNFQVSPRQLFKALQELQGGVGMRGGVDVFPALEATRPFLCLQWAFPVREGSVLKFLLLLLAPIAFSKLGPHIPAWVRGQCASKSPTPHATGRVWCFCDSRHAIWDLWLKPWVLPPPSDCPYNRGPIKSCV